VRSYINNRQFLIAVEGPYTCTAISYCFGDNRVAFGNTNCKYMETPEKYMELNDYEMDIGKVTSC